MTQVQRGFFGALDKYINYREPITVKLVCSGGGVYDFACFGVNSRNCLADESYMIFYNQKASAYREISVNLLDGMALFNIDLDRIPDSVHKLVFSVSIDGEGGMNEVGEFKAILMQRDKELLTVSYSGQEIFNQEKSAIYLELTHSREWDISLVCQGFAGDLGDLVRYFGEEVEEDKKEAAAAERSPALELPDDIAGIAEEKAGAKPTGEATQGLAAESAELSAGIMNTQDGAANRAAETPSEPEASALSSREAERRTSAGEKAEAPLASAEAVVNTEAESALINYTEGELSGCIETLLDRLRQLPELQPLAEPLSRSVLKHGLRNCRAKVCLVLDGSGSTTVQWLNGAIQKIAALIAPLSAYLADKIQFDIWFFAKEQLRGGTVTAANYNDSIPQVGKKTADGLDYFALIKQIGSFNDEENIIKALIEAYGSEREPVYIAFVSGGGIKESEGLPKLLEQSGAMPIFWQFIGINTKKDYGIFKSSEKYSNSGFLMADGIADTDRQEIYDGLLCGFRVWLGKRNS